MNEKLRVAQHRRNLNVRPSAARQTAGCIRLAVLLLAACVVAVGVSPTVASPLLIDNFTTPAPGNFYVVGSHEIVSSYPTGMVLGGQRDMLLTTIGSPQPVSVVANVGYDAPLNMSDLEVATIGNAPGFVQLQYSGVHSFNTANGVLVNGYALGGAPNVGIDLTHGGLNSVFGLTIGSTDEALGISVTITSPGPGGTQLSSTLFAPPIQTDLTTATLVTLPFSGFVGGASIHDVDSVTFSFNTGAVPNIDFSLLSINTQAVPEPSSYVLSAAGFTALVGLGMRTKKRLLGVGGTADTDESPPLDDTAATEPQTVVG